VVEARKKHLVLILAREFASNLATPTLIADDQGRLVFYNEAAEGVLGRTFAETGEMSLEDWAEQFHLGPQSQALPLERRPTGIALYQRRPRTSIPGHEHGRRRANGCRDRVPRSSRADEFVGIVAIFWRE
jgi:PAS domain-containing protein